MPDGNWSNERKIYMAMKDACIEFVELADAEMLLFEYDEYEAGKLRGIAIANDILSINYAKLFNVLS